YRFLRDRECIEDPDEDLLVVRGDNWLSGEELDQEIDTALRLEALQQQVVPEPQP
ncbi:carbon storage regulator, partial [Klebsiella pneumoniae]